MKKLRTGVLIILYALSVWGARACIRQRHLKEWTHIDAGAAEILVTFCPVVNSIAALDGLTYEMNANKFFDIPNAPR